MPVRPRVTGQGEAQQPVASIAPQVSPLTVDAGGTETFQADRALHAMLARLTGGISPAALLLAYTDWLSHLASSPQRQMEIAQEAQVDSQALRRSRAALLLARAGTVVVDQAAAAGPAVRPAGVGTAAVQSDGAGLPAQPAVVAQRHHRRARRVAAERGDRRVFDPADARRAVALQFRRDQSGGAAESVRERRREFRARLAELVQRLGARDVGGPWSGRDRRFRRRQRPSRRRPARSCSATI